MKFDSAFLAARAAKQSDWASQGKKTGSGRPFTSVGLTGFGGQAVVGGDGRIKKNKSKSKKPNVVGEFEISPHAKALAALGRNPELRTGGVVNGKRRNASHEHWEQVILFDWLYRCLREFYDDFTANPMGGLRDNKTAGELYAEGVKSGYPDVTFDYPSGLYHGMRIELKYGKNKPSPNQIKTLNHKRERGYFCCVCYGWEECREAILEYISLKEGQAMEFCKNELLWLLAA